MATRTSYGKLASTFLVIVFWMATFAHLALGGSLSLSWDAVGDSRVAGYKVKYGTTSRSYTNSVDAGLSTNQLLPNLVEGTRYYIVVVAYDGARVEGSPSPETSGVVLATASVAASSVAATSAVITWQTNKPSDQQVHYGATTAYGASTSLDSTLSLTHSQTLTNLQPQTTYHFRVKSRDEGGSTAQSADYTFVTPSEILISALSPAAGPTGAQVLISGSGFGTTAADCVVTFSGVTAPVVSWGQSSITTSVPSGAISGPVLVKVKQTPSNAVNFKINGKLVPPGRVKVRN